MIKRADRIGLLPVIQLLSCFEFDVGGATSAPMSSVIDGLTALKL